MAARVEAAREDAPAAGPAATTAVRQQDSSGVKEVSLTAFRVQFPGLVSMGGGE